MVKVDTEISPMVRETQIRRAVESDLPAMQEVARRTIDRCYRAFLGDEGVDWFINSGESDEELRRGLDNCDVILLDEIIVGFTIYFNDLIHLMMVDVDLHRSGLGSKLLSHAEKQLADAGNTTMRLETFEGNQQAISFYLKNGWQLTRREKDKEYGFVRVFFEKTADQSTNQIE